PIMVREGATARVPTVEVRQFRAEHGALDSVHALVPPDELVAITHARAVVTELLDRLRERRVVRRHRAGVAVSPEVLAGVETERRAVAEAARPPSFVDRAVGLARVFECQ